MATVLYVDDEEAIRRAVSTWLTRRGHVVHAAADAASARAIVRAEPLDGAFIDLWIGADSGLDLLEWIDAHDPSLGQRTAFVTGDLFNAGLGGSRLDRPVLTKPFELRQMDELAASWGDQRHGPPGGRHRDIAATNRDDRVTERGS